MDVFKLRSQIINSEVKNFSTEPSLYHHKALKRIFFAQDLNENDGCQILVYSDQSPFDLIQRRIIKALDFNKKPLDVFSMTFSEERRSAEE